MNKSEAIDLNTHLDTFGMKHCPIDHSIFLIGKKFTLHILRNMILLKQNKFSHFLKSIENINTKTLSIRLQEMENAGLIERTVRDQRPVEIIYSLTKKGESLETLLAFLASFSLKYESNEVFKDKEPRTLKQTFGTNILSEVYD